jgi:TonB family protein
MRSAVVLVGSLGVLLGCATENGAVRYSSTYKVGDVQTELSAEQAEQVHKELTNAKLQQVSSKFDKPLRFLKAPQPTMDPSDIEANVTGKVVAQFVFSESGEVASIDILESTKDSLAKAVEQAVKRWRIEPASSAGRPVKVHARQTFVFKVE